MIENFQTDDGRSISVNETLGIEDCQFGIRILHVGGGSCLYPWHRIKSVFYSNEGSAKSEGAEGESR